MPDENYKVGDPFTATYIIPPVPPEEQYKIGQSVSIFDASTGEWLADYVVEETDGTTIRGRITKVKE